MTTNKIQYGYTGATHCSRCHGEHVGGTTYICVPTGAPCSKCNPNINDKHYKYCPHCGKKL